MSDDAAAKQAALEEKRRAARRARVLNASGSRLDSICGLVGGSNSSASSDPTPQVSANETHQHSPSAVAPSSPASSVHDPAVAPLINEFPVLPDSNDASGPSPTRVTKSRISTVDSTPKKPASNDSIPASINTSPLAAAFNEQSHVTPKISDLKQKQALVVGLILALALSIIEVKYPKYSTTASTAFWAMDMLMWVGVFVNGASAAPSTFNLLLTTLLPSNPEGSNLISKGVSQAMGWTKAVYHVLQDWLIAQFFTLLWSALKSGV